MDQCTDGARFYTVVGVVGLVLERWATHYDQPLAPGCFGTKGGTYIWFSPEYQLTHCIWPDPAIPH